MRHFLSRAILRLYTIAHHEDSLFACFWIRSGVLESGFVHLLVGVCILVADVEVA